MRALSSGLNREQYPVKAMRKRQLLGAVGVTLMLVSLEANGAGGATTIPVLWTAGGLSAGIDSAGQAARIATDASGNVAVVSGPSLGRDLAVTSYSPNGSFRWRRSVSPSIGTFRGDWVAAAPNGDFAAVGRNVDSHGNPIAITLVRLRRQRNPAVARGSRSHVSIRRTAVGRFPGQHLSGIQLGW